MCVAAKRFGVVGQEERRREGRSVPPAGCLASLSSVPPLLPCCSTQHSATANNAERRIPFEDV